MSLRRGVRRPPEGRAPQLSPLPEPEFVATFKTKAPALSLGRGLDRAIDESGSQLAVFNRLGARPFDFAETTRLYRLPDGGLFSVPD